MISLRGLTDHTIKSYSTYIRVYLDYLSNILHKLPEDVSWAELRDFILWLQREKNLSDRTVNCAISQLRFFTLYALHKPWDHTQLPLRKFDSYLPYVPSQDGWEDVSSSGCLSPIQKKAANSLLTCKSGFLGCNISVCPDCGHTEVHNNSCRNRNCPNCQAVNKEI